MNAWKISALAIAIAISFAFAAISVMGSNSEPGAPPAPSQTPTPTLTPTPTPTATPTPSPSRTARAAPATCGPRIGKLFVYHVWIEPGQRTTVAEFQRALHATLCDARGWLGSGTVRFRYDPNGAKRISLRSARGTEKRCTQILGYPAGTYYSCAGKGEAVLNGARWFGGSKHWPGPVGEYRRMLTNHEVGHLLGMRHRQCPGDGKPAPVMQQQSKGLKGCTRNPWPTRAEERALPWGR